MFEKLNIHSLPFLLTSLLFFVLPLIVVVKNKKSAVNRSFFVLGLSAALWQFPYFLIYNLKNSVYIIPLVRLAYIGLILVAPSLYSFIVSFLNLNKKNLIKVFYAAFSVFIIIVLSGDLIVAGARKFAWGICIIPGQAYRLFLTAWASPSILSLVHLYKAYRQADSPYNKKRIKFFVVTLSVAFLALIDSLIIYGIDMYPIGFLFLIFFGISTAYAVLRYRLVDIDIIIKKVTLIALAYTVSVSLIYAGTFYLHSHFIKILGKNWIILPIAVSIGVGVGLFKFINFVRHIEEDELSKRFAYRPVLKREAARISQARNIKELVTYLIRDLSSWIRLDYAGIFVLDIQANEFVLTKDVSRVKRQKQDPSQIVLSFQSPLVREILKRKKPLVRSELEFLLGNKSIPARDEASISKVLCQMKTLGFQTAIPSFCEGELVAIINIGNKLSPNETITAEDLELLSSLSSNIGRAIFGFMLKEEKIRLIVASQKTLISAIEAKDGYTYGHTDRVAKYTNLIGKRLIMSVRGFSYGLSNLNWSAQLHDVGKIAIPDDILLKPGPLTKAEWMIVKEHPVNGIKIIRSVREWLGEDICAGILHHHENIDGSGYPANQKGGQIHLFARIIRVVDAFDAMITDRPYRPAKSRQEALAELTRYKGLYFDKTVVETVEQLCKDNQM